MRKSKLFLLFFMTVIVIVCTCIFNVSASSFSKGMSFSQDNAYECMSTFSKMPSTLEATVYFEKNTTIRGGIILGNYTESKVPCINFEITKNGNPRVYIVDDEENTYDFSFKDVNVYTGKWTHIAITVDYASGTMLCYIDGEYKDSISFSPISSFLLTKLYYLGGDGRPGNAQYFKGLLKDLAVYSDVRTADEIKSDYTSKTFDESELLGCYDFSDQDAGTYPEKIVCEKKKGINFIYQQKWIRDKEPITDYAYSFAVVGDTQSLTKFYPDKLSYIYDWIVANKESKNIQFVFGLGDITNNDTDEEWILAKSQITKLNSIVPYSLVRGNHDGTSQYVRYLSYSEFRNTSMGSFDNTMLNTYQKFTVGNIKYLVINLDIVASDAILEWANKIVEDHPDHNVIVTTHIYMYKSGATYPLDSIAKYGAQNNGDGIWSKFLSKHKNIVLLICGHNPTDYIVVKESRGRKGNMVTQMLVDPQATDRNWDATGLIAMMYFSKDGSEVQVEYYSTVKDAYYLPENQFSMKLNVIKQKEDVTTTDKNKIDTGEPTDCVDLPENDSNNTIFIIAIVGITIVLMVISVLIFVHRKKGNKK